MDPKACFATPDQRTVTVLNPSAGVITLGSRSSDRCDDRPKPIGGSGLIRDAAAAIVMLHPDADADAVLLWAEARAFTTA